MMMISNWHPDVISIDLSTLHLGVNANSHSSEYPHMRQSKWWVTLHLHQTSLFNWSVAQLWLLLLFLQQSIHCSFRIAYRIPVDLSGGHHISAQSSYPSGESDQSYGMECTVWMGVTSVIYPCCQPLVCAEHDFLCKVLYFHLHFME